MNYFSLVRQRTQSIYIVEWTTPYFTLFTIVIGVDYFFFSELIKWLNKDNAPLSPSTELILGKEEDNINKELNIIRKLNFTFLYAKYYLYNQKLLHGELLLKEYIGNVNLKYNFEKFKCSWSDVERSVMQDALECHEEPCFPDVL